MQHHIVHDNDNYNNQETEINIIYNDIIINPMDETEDEDEYELGPPEGFDMNSASVVEYNPEYADNLINAQVEYEGIWYFALEGQIYSVPYEIEIDDEHVRHDIRNNWPHVRWAGTIFGHYVAWY